MELQKVKVSAQPIRKCFQCDQKFGRKVRRRFALLFKPGEISVLGFHEHCSDGPKAKSSNIVVLLPRCDKLGARLIARAAIELLPQLATLPRPPEPDAGRSVAKALRERFIAMSAKPDPDATT